MSSVPVDMTSQAAPDRLAGALLRHLHRRHRQVGIGGAARAMAGALLSFGLWPLIKWPRRFKDFVVIQQMQVAHLADWMQEAVGADAARPLQKAADRVQFRTWLWVLSLMAAGAVVADFAVHVERYGLSFRDILAITWRYDGTGRSGGQTSGDLHLLWLVGLSVAYLLHWVQVKLHAWDVQRVTDAFNALTRREQLATVQPARARYRVISAWTIGALLLGMLGAWWGVAMMLAGSVHRAYTERSTPSMRRSLSQVLRTMLLLRRPSMRIPTPVWMTRQCPNQLCGHRALTEASFCPRCGTRL